MCTSVSGRRRSEAGGICARDTSLRLGDVDHVAIDPKAYLLLAEQDPIRIEATASPLALERRSSSRSRRWAIASVAIAPARTSAPASAAATCLRYIVISLIVVRTHQPR